MENETFEKRHPELWAVCLNGNKDQDAFLYYLRLQTRIQEMKSEASRIAENITEKATNNEK